MEFILIPLAILITAFFDIRIIQQIEAPGTETVSEHGWQKKIAVLPFDNLGPPEDDYFAMGITEEITSRLASVHELGVISRTSAEQYDRTGKTIRQVGEDLGVDYVLEGSVRWDRDVGNENRVRITPQLIRASDDIHLWSNRYDRVIEDIFEVQSDIAGQVIQQLDLILLEPEQRALGVKPTENLDAYQAYLRGIDYLNKPDDSEEEIQMAVHMFKRAVELDSGFALAFAGLSDAQSRIVHYGFDLTEECKQEAKAAADRALELQPELPEAHLALGKFYYLCHKDYDKALKELSIAEKDLPNDRTILEYMGHIRRRQGHFMEAIKSYKKAFELDPQNAYLPREIGTTYMTVRRYAEAEHYYSRSISLAPDQAFAYCWKAWNYVLWEGSLEKARATLEETPKTNDSFYLFSFFRIENLERNYQAALEWLPSGSEYFLKGEKEAWTGNIYQLMNENKLARAYYDSARIQLENEVKDYPDNPDIHWWLGFANAGLGRKEEAIWEGKLAIDLYPVSKDALAGPDYLIGLAEILVMVEEYDAALDQIEYLLSIPSLMTVSRLQIDPTWDPLRDHPRFSRLLEKYSKDDS